MRNWNLIGLLSTTIIVLILFAYTLNEPRRMANTQAKLLTASIAKGQAIFDQNCAGCHGVNGQGFILYPALNHQGVQEMDYDIIFKTIERGRYDTAMPAWGVAEGGKLAELQIDQLIEKIQQGDWEAPEK